MSYLTPILCTGNRTTHSETSTKTQCILCWRHECFANSRWDLKSAKLKCSQRHYFSSTAKLKYRKIKFLDQNTKSKCCRQTFKNLSVKKGKKKVTKMHLFWFTFLRLNKLEMFFQKQTFYFLVEGNKQTWKPLITQMKEPRKSCSEARRSIVKTGRFYIKLYMSIFTRENFSSPAQIFLNESLYMKPPESLIFFSWKFTFIVAGQCRHV